MRATVLFSAFVAIVLAAPLNAAPTSPQVARANVDSLDIRGWIAGVVEARAAVADNTRLQMLKAQQSALESQKQALDQLKLKLTQITDALVKQKVQPGSAAAKQVDAELQQVKDADIKLNAESKRVDLELAAVDKEINAAAAA